LTMTRTPGATAPVLCHHCEDAPCLRVCPVAAISMAGGRVALNEQRCVSCKMCSLACPFGAITPSGTSISGVAGMRIDQPADSVALDPLLAWNIGVRAVAVKCDLCWFREQGPECVRVCPTHALRTVDDAALQAATDARRRVTAAALLYGTGFVPPAPGAAPHGPSAATGESD